jgi:nuclear mRNA export protein PCID2/THP1
MLTGRFPSSKLLQAFDLPEYVDMVEACQNGDMSAFESALEKNMDVLIKSGVFTTVEQIRLVTLRNFVRRIATAVQSTPELQKQGKPNIISL